MSQRITPKRVEEAIKQMDKPFATAPDIADLFDVTTQTVYNAQDDLDDYDGLECAEVGRSTVWYHAEIDLLREIAEDETVTDAIEAVAAGYDREPSELSVTETVRETCRAYCGYHTPDSLGGMDA